MLADLLTGPPEDVHRGRLLVETLERRQLMAGDVDLFATNGVDTTTEVVAADIAATDTATSSPVTLAPVTPTILTTTTQAEGEPAPDLVAFAELLEQLNVRFYGADWCPACRQQKELFGDGYDNVPFIEVTNPDRTINSVGTANNISQYPTWDFPSGQRLVGVQTLDALAAAAGVSIPVSDTPSFEPIGDQTVAIGSPLHVVVDASDPGDGPVTTTVTVADPSLVSGTVITGNRSIRIDVENYGVMVFEMFEGRAPRTTGQIIQLIQDGFYDRQPNGDQIEFHRVIDSFVLQAGDPTGTGAGGSNLPDVDDEFHPELQHNREGIFSFAKAGDDTNNSQFFITENPTRTLDYNHSVMGQLVEGFDVREAISRVATNAADRPQFPIRINSVTVFEDNENSLIMLRPESGQTGATTATITTTDADGNASSETIDIFVVEDSGSTANSQPYLTEIANPPATPAGTPATLQLNSIDIEGDPVRYSAFDRTSGTAIAVDVDPNTGLVTVTPPADFVGTAEVETRVEWVTPAFAGQFDSQLVEFEFVESGAPETLVVPNAPRAFVGETYTADIDVSSGDETGVVYSLSNPPAGAAIDPATGVLSFTPTAAQIGTVSVGVIAARDNVALDTATIDITVASAAASYEVELTDLNGSPLTSLSIGQEFLVTLVAEDTRPFPSNTGVFAAAADLLFDPALVRPVDGESIAFLQPLDDLNGGTIGNGILDNVRGVSPSTSGRTDPRSPFARLRFEAVGGGTATLQTASAADAEDTLLLDLNNRISATEIAYNAATIEITSDVTLVDDTFTVAEDSASTTLDVLANDTSASGNPLVITAVNPPTAGGTVSLDNGQIRFTPAADFIGDATFTYTAGEAGGTSSVAGVTVTVTGVNDPPVAADDNFSVGTNQSSRNLDVLANDNSGPETGETLTITDVSATTAGGTVAIAADGLSIDYTPPNASTAASDTFTYTISDGDATATATVTIDLDAVPTAADDTFTATEDTDETFDPLANDTADPDGQTFTIVSLGTPSAGGTATIVDGGTRIAYSPAGNFNGTETLSYTIRDTGGGESTATMTFNVAAVNDVPPTGTFERSVVRLSDQTLEQTVLRLSDLPANVDADESIRFSDVTIGNAATGTVRVSPEGTELIFVPTESAVAVSDTITFTVTDAGGLSSTGTIAVTVNDYQLRSIAVRFGDTNFATRDLFDSSPRLEGTSIDGNAVSMDAVVGDDGTISFDALAPGSYEIVVPANPFLQGRETEQRIAVNSDVDDGDTEVTPAGGLLRPEFISIQDFLGSTSRSSVLVAVSPGGNSTLTIGGGNASVRGVTGSLDGDGQQLTLRGTDTAAADAAAQQVSSTLPVTGDARVQSRGRVGDVSLYRINLDDPATMFAPASTADPGGSSAAGTSAAGTSLAGSDPFDDTSGFAGFDPLPEGPPSDLASQNIDTGVNDAAISDVFGDG